MMALGQLPILAEGRSQEPAPQAQPARPSPNGCRVTGRVVSGTLPLPGVSIVVRVGDAIKAATSTDGDGKFAIIFGPNATYHVTAELMAFGKAERDLTLGALPCDSTLDLSLSLSPRNELPPAAAPSAPDARSRGDDARGRTPRDRTTGHGRRRRGRDRSWSGRAAIRTAQRPG